MESCCADPNNRIVHEARPAAGGAVVVEVCRVCGRKHYTFVTEPVAFGTRMSDG